MIQEFIKLFKEQFQKEKETTKEVEVEECQSYELEVVQAQVNEKELAYGLVKTK